MKTRRLIVCRGDGPRASLLLSVLVNLQTLRAGSPSVVFRLDVEVPMPGDVTLDRYLSAHPEYLYRLNVLKDPKPYDQARTMGAHHVDLERWEEALSSYRRALALYDERGRDTRRDGLTEVSPHHTALAVVRCLRNLGRLEEALQELDRIEKEMPALPIGTYRTSIDYRTMVIAARMCIASSYLDQGDRERARKLVEEENAHRPDHRTLSSMVELFEKGFSGPSEAMKERYRQYSRYLPVDRMLLRLQEEPATRGR